MGRERAQRIRTMRLRLSGLTTFLEQRSCTTLSRPYVLEGRKAVVTLGRGDTLECFSAMSFLPLLPVKNGTPCRECGRDARVPIDITRGEGVDDHIIPPPLHPHHFIFTGIASSASGHFSPQLSATSN